jgi:heptosyltransferase-2
VGLNTGCGPVFSGKKWTEEGFVALAEGIADAGAQVVLLGGPAERERNRRIRERARVPLADPGCDNPLDVFAGIVGACDVIVTGDTLALHVAIGLRREVVLLMGPTAAAEIDLFGRGEILQAGRGCAPCYLRDCPDGDPAPCMSAIPLGEVLAAVERRLARAGGNRE